MKDQKRKYNEARLSVVRLSGKQQLLAGSDAGGGGNAPQMMGSTTIGSLGAAESLQ